MDNVKGPHGKELFRPADNSFEEVLAADPLKDFFVWWLEGHKQADAALRRALSTARTERPIQKCIEQNPIILARLMSGGHGRWLIPHKRLGAEHGIDFVVGQKSSVGFEWLAVEIEAPTHRLFNKNGDLSKALSHAVRQIIDWRSWLSQNIDYASRQRCQSGLGLTDIDGNVSGLIIIGRRHQENQANTRRRRTLAKQLGIEIHTYDWLLSGLYTNDDHAAAARKKKKTKR